MKKIISAVLSLCIAASAFSVFDYSDFGVVSAEEAYVFMDENGERYTIEKDEENSFIYRLYSDHVEIDSILSNAGSEIVLPSEYKGLKITALKTAIPYDATMISIPETITYVYDNSFKSESLLAINVDKNNPAFCDENGVLFNKDKTELICYPGGVKENKFIVPKYLEKIGPMALACSNISEFMVESGNNCFSIKDGVLFDKNQTTLIRYPVSKTETEYIVPDSVSVIHDAAFYKNSYLSTVGLHENINVIGQSAFEGCVNLLKLDVPKSVTELNDSVCRDCSSLTSVSLPNGLERIGNFAFAYCSALSTINIPDTVNCIGRLAFSSCIELISIDLPDSLTVLSDNLFSGCKKLKSITLPSSISEIGEMAFMYCDELKTIVIPKSVSKLDPWAVSYCNTLESITILNPNCNIEDCEIVIFKAQEPFAGASDGKRSPSPSFVQCSYDGIIYGYAGSTAQEYAEKYGYKFSALEENKAEPSETPAVTPTAEPTETPAVTPTAVSTETPVATPTAVPTETPAATPTAEPTETPVVTPTAEPKETPVATPTTEPTVAPSADIPEGDINEDEVINTGDLISMIKMIIGQTKSSTSADINKDGNVDASDLMLLKKTLAK